MEEKSAQEGPHTEQGAQGSTDPLAIAAQEQLQAVTKSSLLSWPRVSLLLLLLSAWVNEGFFSWF